MTPVSEGARSDAHGGHAGDQTDQHSKARSLELTVEPPVAPPPTVGPVDAGATTARNSATVAIWTLLSRVTGLLRVVVIGAVLGPTYFANSFQSTNVVPNIVFSLIAGPVLTMVVVPGLMSALHTDGGQRGREVFARVSGWLLLVGCGFVALLAASPVVAWTLTWGIPTAAERSHGLWLTTLLVVLLAPQLLGYCLVHLGISAQRAHGKFALSAAAPAIENVILIAVLLAAGLIYGPGLDIAHVPISLVITLGAGSTIAVAIHAAVQLFGAARVGLLAWPSLRWRDDAQAVAVTRRLSRSVGVAALPSGAMYVLFALADAVPGGVFVVQMCYAVLYALSYLSSRAVSMASLPELADAARAGDLGQFGVIWSRGLAFALIAGLPLMILLGILGQPTATVLANGALEHAAVVGPLGICLAVVAVAQLVTGLADLGNQALYAREQDRVPRLASRVTLAVTLGVAVGAVVLIPAGGDRLIGLVLAVLVGELAATFLVLGQVRASVRPTRFVDRSMLGITLAAAVAMSPIAGLTWWVYHVLAPDQLGTLALLLAGGVLAVGVYGLVLRSTWRPRRVGRRELGRS